MIKFTNDNYCFICWKILRCYKFSYPLCLTPVIRSLVQEWRRLTITDWPVLTFINPFHDVYSGICLYDRVIALKGSRYIWHSNIFFFSKTLYWGQFWNPSIISTNIQNFEKVCPKSTARSLTVKWESMYLDNQNIYVQRSFSQYKIANDVDGRLLDSTCSKSQPV